MLMHKRSSLINILNNNRINQGQIFCKKININNQINNKISHNTTNLGPVISAKN